MFVSASTIAHRSGTFLCNVTTDLLGLQYFSSNHNRSRIYKYFGYKYKTDVQRFGLLTQCYCHLKKHFIIGLPTQT